MSGAYGVSLSAKPHLPPALAAVSRVGHDGKNRWICSRFFKGRFSRRCARVQRAARRRAPVRELRPVHPAPGASHKPRATDPRRPGARGNLPMLAVSLDAPISARAPGGAGHSRSGLLRSPLHAHRTARPCVATAPGRLEGPRAKRTDANPRDGPAEWRSGYGRSGKGGSHAMAGTGCLPTDPGLSRPRGQDGSHASRHPTGPVPGGGNHLGGCGRHPSRSGAAGTESHVVARGRPLSRARGGPGLYPANRDSAGREQSLEQVPGNPELAHYLEFTLGAIAVFPRRQN